MAATITIASGGTILDNFSKSFVDVPVAENKAVSTTEFLLAAESLTAICGRWRRASHTTQAVAALSRLCSDPAPSRAADSMGSIAFTPVKSDILGNVTVRAGVPRCPGARARCLCPGACLAWEELPGELADPQPMLQKLRERQLEAPDLSENVQDLCRNELKTKKHRATEGLLWLVRWVARLRDSLRTDGSRDAAVRASSPPRQRPRLHVHGTGPQPEERIGRDEGVLPGRLR